MPRFADMNDSELAAWTINFSSVAGVTPSDYGLTAAQITDLQTISADLQSKMTARLAAEDAARAAVAAQKTTRAALEPICSYYNTIIKANPDITDAAKTAAGIDIKKTPT